MSGLVRVGHWQNQETFSSESFVARGIKLEQAIAYSLMGLSASLLVGATVLARVSPSWLKTAALSIGLVGSATATVYAGVSSFKAKTSEAVDTAQQALIQQKVESKLRLALAKLQVHEQRQLIDLAMSQPEEWQNYFLDQLDLGEPEYPQLAPVPMLAEVEQSTVSLPLHSGTVQARDWMQVARDNSLPQIRDCARDIAELDGHIAMVSRTRSGKTTLMIAVISYALSLGHEVYLIDGKGDERLRAIKGINYVQCNEPEKVDGAEAMIEHILTELSERQSPDYKNDRPPISVFVDENNLIRDSVIDSGGTKKLGNERCDKWDRSLKRLVLQGAAAKIYLRASAHTSRVEDWGWNTGVLDSLTFMALARNGSYESVEDLIQYQVRDKATAQAKLAAMKQTTIKEPVILTLLQPQGFYRLPLYQAPEQSNLPPSTDWQGKESSHKPSQSTNGINWLDAIKKWSTKLDHEPTDPELVAMLAKVAPNIQKPTKESLQWLREQLH